MREEIDKRLFMSKGSLFSTFLHIFPGTWKEGIKCELFFLKTHALFSCGISLISGEIVNSLKFALN